MDRPLNGSLPRYQFLQVYLDPGPSLSGMADYGCISGLTVFTGVRGLGAIIKWNGRLLYGCISGLTVFTGVSGPGAIVTLAQQRPLEQETLAPTYRTRNS